MHAQQQDWFMALHSADSSTCEFDQKARIMITKKFNGNEAELFRHDHQQCDPGNLGGGGQLVLTVLIRQYTSNTTMQALISVPFLEVATLNGWII